MLRFVDFAEKECAMNALKRFFLNASILTLTALLMRTVSVSFNVFLSDRVGEEGMGLYSLVMSVYSFAVTLACSGVGFASTRLTAEAMGRGSDRAVRDALWRCVWYSLSFGLAASVLLYVSAPFLGTHFLGDVRTVPSLRLLAPALPLLSLSSVFGGYFNAVRRSARSAASSLSEQLVCVLSTVLLLTLFDDGGGLEASCLRVAAGVLIGEAVSFVLSFLLLLHDLRKHNTGRGGKDKNTGRRLFSIALPLAFGSYVRMGLVSLEHTLIPKMLKKHGMSGEEALAGYGLVHGMVLPVVLFPSAFLSSFTSLLIPELAERRMRGETESINRIAAKALRTSLFFSVGASALVYCFAYELSILLYSSPDAFPYIRALALLIPIMYTDTTTDCLLKGLDQQMSSMGINIFDALLSVAAVCILPPALGLEGYVIAIFAGEIVNFALSLSRLLQACTPALGLRDFFAPIPAASLALCGVTILFDRLGLTAFSSLPNVVLRMSLAALLYLLLILAPKYNFWANKTALKTDKAK